MKFHLLIILTFVFAIEAAFGQPDKFTTSEQYNDRQAKELVSLIDRNDRELRASDRRKKLPKQGLQNKSEAARARRQITGRVVGVQDGHTCTVLDSNNKLRKIRFEGIDAPELKRSFGEEAKKNLSYLILGKEVTVIYGKTDKYGVTVGKVIVAGGGTNANLYQIQSGMARHHKKFQDEQTPEDRRAYAEAEIKARRAKLGIWSQPGNTPARDYRGEKKKPLQAEEKADREYLIGPDGGGCYYLNAAGAKTYVDAKNCSFQTLDRIPASTRPEPLKADNPDPDRPARPDGGPYLRDSRGECYYINSSGNKTYVKKELCDR